MSNIFSDRITDVPRSFIREILKVGLDPSVISFAGGLPNRKYFPVKELKEATNKVYDLYGQDVCQYSNSEGLLGLREFVSKRYKDKFNLDIPVEEILITNGSQQGLDLLGKITLNEGDSLIIEEPGYLGAIQAFSIYQPKFCSVPVNENGMNTERLEKVLNSEKPKLMYTVPNFQNPSGISYSNENRGKIAEIVKGTNTLLIEDNPYGDLRFKGEKKTSFKDYLPDNTILLGSFSKIVVPGFRLGWIVAPENVMKNLITAKQAADLHTTHFTQSIVLEYLKKYNIEKHINTVKDAYGRQCYAMQESIKKYFPPEIKHTDPEGGMFLWAELPQGMSALKLFDIAAKDKVIFVPGDPFYINKRILPDFFEAS
jgi:2-aminoadipate transaminase